MKANTDSWVLYQLYDAVLDRWSSVFSVATVTALRMEIDEMVKMQPNRPALIRFLGEFCDGERILEGGKDIVVNELAWRKLEAPNEVSAAE